MNLKLVLEQCVVGQRSQQKNRIIKDLVLAFWNKQYEKLQKLLKYYSENKSDLRFILVDEFKVAFMVLIMP